MSKPLASRRCLATIIVLCLTSSSQAAQNHSYQDGGKTFHYSVTQTGENNTFEFAENPGVVNERLRAVNRVFADLYGDSSMATKHRYFFMKEGAKCFVYDASLYEYQACFLPNEYSPGNEQRFWGYVTRIPNGWWLFTHNILPGLGVLAAALYFLFRK